MDKKTILAFVIVGIIIILWPVYEEKVLGVKRQTRKPTTQQVQKPKDTEEVKSTPSPVLSSGISVKKNKPSVTERPDTLILETDTYYGKLSTTGGGTVISWKMKKYLNSNGKPVELIPDSAEGNLGIVVGNSAQNQIDLADKNFKVLLNTKSSENGKLHQKIVFRYDLSGYGKIEKEFVAVDGTYDVQFQIRFIPMTTERSFARYFIFWKSGLAPTEKNIRDENNYYEAIALQGNEMLKSKSDATGLREGVTSWAAIRTKYFLASIIPVGVTATATELKGEKIQIRDEKGNPAPWKRLTAALSVPARNSQSDTSRMILYLGPMDYHQLKSYGVQLEKNMNFGWILIRPFSIAFLYALEFLYKIVHNYGWAIIIFAIMIKILLHPLTKKSMQSMKKMQALQPKIESLREKFKSEPQKLNAETMKLYKTHGINPMGGCLPMLLQMPILFALFNLFRTTIMLRQAEFLGIIKDLSYPDRIIQTGQIAVNVLPILMGVSMIVQQKLTMQDSKQKFMTYFMSVFMIYVFYNLSAGLNLYYFVFNVLQIAQELYIRNKKSKVVVETAE